MRKLLLVRHAEPALTGVLLGHTDPPLGEAGLRRAREVLGLLRPAVVYTSPLERARQTAAVIAAPVVVLDELAEISFGDWDGKTWAEVEAAWPELARRKQADWLGVTPPGGEDWASFRLRIHRALDRIRGGPFPAVAVAHAGVNAEMAHQLTGADPAAFAQDYCGALEYELDPGSAAAAAD